MDSAFRITLYSTSAPEVRFLCSSSIGIYVVKCMRSVWFFSFIPKCLSLVFKNHLLNNQSSLQWIGNDTLIIYYKLFLSHTYTSVHVCAYTVSHTYIHIGLYVWTFICLHWFVCPFQYSYHIVKIILANNILLSERVTLLKIFHGFSTC